MQSAIFKNGDENILEKICEYDRRYDTFYLN